MKSSFSWLVLLLVPLAAGGQPSKKPVDAVAAQFPDDEIKPIKLKIYPASEPVPALRYRLLPELLEKKPGNAAVMYFRGFSPEWNTANNKEVQKALTKWWEEGEGETPPKILEFVLFDNSLKEMDLAARMSHCDWQLNHRLTSEGIGLLLPELQGFREKARLLQLRTRFQMLKGDYDQAIYTLQTSFQMGRDVADGPTLIHALVGIAITRSMMGELELLLQKEDAPNLYWALTDLPRPYISLRKQFQAERAFFDSLFPELRAMARDLEARPLSLRELNDMITKFSEAQRAMGGTGTGLTPWAERIALAVMAAKTYPQARKTLIKQGRPAALVDAMPVLQVAMLYETQNYDRYYDDMVKWWGLPYVDARKGTRDTRDRLMKEIDQTASMGLILAKLLIPAVNKVMETSYFLDRKISGLRCIEAIRLYAAAHDGKLPRSLNDIKEAPVPKDPVLDQPFQYRLKGNTAFLTAPVPPGEPPMENRNTWIYELTLGRPGA